MMPARRLSAARAAVAVLALYGLLLQAFLVAAAPVLPAEAGVLCAAGDGSGSHEPGKPARHDHACCLSAQAGGLAPPPTIPTVIAWTAPRETVSPLRPEAVLPRTGSPTYARSPRGPPLV